MAFNGISEEFIHISSIIIIIRIIPQITFNAYLEEVALNIYRSLKEENLKRGKKNPKPKILEFQFLSFVNRLLKCFFFQSYETSIRKLRTSSQMFSRKLLSIPKEKNSMNFNFKLKSDFNYIFRM